MSYYGISASNNTPVRKGETLTEDVFEYSAAKMRKHGMTDMAIAQFRRLYEVWRNEEASSWIREDEVEPLVSVPSSMTCMRPSITTRPLTRSPKRRS